ncbi:hypothetical protein [Mycobacterium sp. E2733]|uniref:hypothetical protein n=1 Tax=Mycobacterium sp. E2733 TaxID=1834138 RepID=UPI000A792578|nr:hypothetical protein [Mycobacterium sp. E2733]
MHEVHKVRGRCEDDFEAAFRQGWLPMLAAADDARLLWYAGHAQGSGPSYTVVTVTAVRDGAAWERLALRVQRGDLQAWMRELDELRYDVDAKLLAPLPWSPLQDLPLAEVPVDGREHDLSLYMEDTMWPYPDKFDEYIARSGDVYARSLQRPSSIYRPLSHAPARMRILDIQACFQVAHGSNRRREAMLWQKIDDSNNYAALVHLLTKEIPQEHRAPGSYMFDALQYRDQWQSRLLRTSDWSPLY